MKRQTNLRERYIQLVETFITALESGGSGNELEDIRKEIRVISKQLGIPHSVENSTQEFGFLPLAKQKEEKSNGLDTVS